MINRRIIALLVILLSAHLTSSCAGMQSKTEGLPVTAVPPVVYPTPIPTSFPTPVPTLAPTRISAVIPTSMPLATPTPYGYEAQGQSIPEVRAGEVDDNAEWDAYLLYRREYRGPQVHDLDVRERYIISAFDKNNLPILDATVTVWDGQTKLWEARTFATGQTLFFPRAFASSQAQKFIVSVNKADFAYTFDLYRGQQETWVATLGQFERSRQRVNLDVLFLLDATGSMSDEIYALQSSIQSIASQIDNMQPRTNLRFGLVWYRDRGDSFIVRRANFNSNVNTFSQQLEAVRAEGGGDYPESLNEALHVAIHDMDWRDEDTVRLIILVADAPPHLDYRQDYDYGQEMAVAGANGIKIFPIAASGTDDQAEYIFRQLAQFTQGRFLFLTYEGPTVSGEPGDVSTMHVGGYGVQDLDDLVVRLIGDEIANQSYSR